jgi:hypothetical protein
VTDTVYVTNEGEMSLTDGWDGTHYVFAPGKTVEIPAFVAGHIFGHGVEDKTPYVIRLGWAKTTNDLPKALAWLENFVITTEPPLVRRAVSPEATDSAKPPSALPMRRGRGVEAPSTIQ